MTNVVTDGELRRATYLKRLNKITNSLGKWLSGKAPDVFVILGSGISSLVELVDAPQEIGFSEIAELPQTSVEGHPGKFVYGSLSEGRSVLFQLGRIHLYEGHDASEVCLTVHAASSLGIKKFLVTNAVGSLEPEVPPGSLVVVRNLLASTMPLPPAKLYDGSQCDYFTECTNPFDPVWSNALLSALRDFPVHQGSFAWMMGPRYDTAAEIADLRARGHIIREVIKTPSLAPIVVGMSLAPEVIALSNFRGHQVVGLSFVSNYAAGVSDEPLVHDDVLTACEVLAKSIQSTLKQFLIEFSKPS